MKKTQPATEQPAAKPLTAKEQQALADLAAGATLKPEKSVKRPGFYRIRLKAKKPYSISTHSLERLRDFLKTTADGMTFHLASVPEQAAPKQEQP